MCFTGVIRLTVPSNVEVIATACYSPRRCNRAIEVSVVMGRNALEYFRQQITRRRTANVAQTEDADHPLALVDHWQSADLQLFHVPHRLGEVVVLAAAMDPWGHHVARCGAAGIEAVLRQPFADNVAVSHHADKSGHSDRSEWRLYHAAASISRG